MGFGPSPLWKLKVSENHSKIFLTIDLGSLLENKVKPRLGQPSPHRKFFLDLSMMVVGQSVYSKTAHTQKAKVCTFL